MAVDFQNKATFSVFKKIRNTLLQACETLVIDFSFSFGEGERKIRFQKNIFHGFFAIL